MIIKRGALVHAQHAHRFNPATLWKYKLSLYIIFFKEVV